MAKRTATVHDRARGDLLSLLADTPTTLEGAYRDGDIVALLLSHPATVVEILLPILPMADAVRLPGVSEAAQRQRAWAAVFALEIERARNGVGLPITQAVASARRIADHAIGEGWEAGRET